MCTFCGFAGPNRMRAFPPEPGPSGPSPIRTFQAQCATNISTLVRPTSMVAATSDNCRFDLALRVLTHVCVCTQRDRFHLRPSQLCFAHTQLDHFDFIGSASSASPDQQRTPIPLAGPGAGFRLERAKNQRGNLELVSGPPPQTGRIPDRARGRGGFLNWTLALRAKWLCHVEVALGRWRFRSRCDRIAQPFVARPGLLCRLERLRARVCAHEVADLCVSLCTSVWQASTCSQGPCLTHGNVFSVRTRSGFCWAATCLQARVSHFQPSSRHGAAASCCQGCRTGRWKW